MVRGVVLGVDVGTVRVGVARSDPHWILATPVATVTSNVADVVALVTEHEAVAVVVGLPLTLRGAEGVAAQGVRNYVSQLEVAIAPVPVHMADERLSTVSAQRRLTARGVSTRNARSVVDQAAAVEILQTWLDASRRDRHD